MSDLSDLMTREETLHDDLLDYLRNGPLGTMIHHPLMISLTYMENHCGLVNMQYSHKKAALQQAVADGNYMRAIGLHERPYRVNAMMEYIDDHDFENHPDYWEAVSFVWTDSENIFQNQKLWERIWKSDAPNRNKVMTPEDRDTFALHLRDSFTVYRGVQIGGTDLGMSWTLSTEKAGWFANRWKQNGYILETEVSKSDVLAFFDTRGEKEIVIFPDKLTEVSKY